MYEYIHIMCGIKILSFLILTLSEYDAMPISSELSHKWENRWLRWRSSASSSSRQNLAPASSDSHSYYNRQSQQLIFPHQTRIERYPGQSSYRKTGPYSSPVQRIPPVNRRPVYRVSPPSISDSPQYKFKPYRHKPKIGSTTAPGTVRIISNTQSASKAVIEDDVGSRPDEPSWSLTFTSRENIDKMPPPITTVAPYTKADPCLAASCGPFSKCSVHQDAFLCSCIDGYVGYPPDVPCELKNPCEGVMCGNNAVCVNAAGNAECRCVPGYDEDEAGGLCSDVDECKLNENNCGENSVCINLNGSYDCGCKEGFHKDQKDDQAICKDINECITRKNACDVNSKCLNTVGSYSCICIDGYEKGIDQICQDINECSSSVEECGLHAVCINTDGSYKCSCISGYTQGPDGCIDVDECVNVEVACGPRASCINTEGSFECQCNIGYSGNPPDLPCQDVNECKSLNITAYVLQLKHAV